MFVNGVLESSVTSSLIMNRNLGLVCIGCADSTGNASLNGKIDDLRITIGTARYTTNFTPPPSDSISVLQQINKVTQGKTFPNSAIEGDYHCLTAIGLQTYKRVNDKWVETQYVPIGHCSVLGGIITSVWTNSYNQNGYDRPYKYISDWFLMTVGVADYTKTHNLGTTNFKYDVLIADDANGTNARHAVDWMYHPNSNSFGYMAKETTDTTISIKPADSYTGWNSAGNAATTSAYFRIIAEVL